MVVKTTFFTKFKTVYTCCTNSSFWEAWHKKLLIVFTQIGQIKERPTPFILFLTDFIEVEFFHKVTKLEISSNRVILIPKITLDDL